MPSNQLPSDAELLLLQALWESPGATVQQVHEWTETAGKSIGYTTVLTQLQRMLKKGLVERERQGRQHHYRAVSDRATTEAALIERLSDTAFSGSPIRLALRALGGDQPTADELAQLECWIAQQKG